MDYNPKDFADLEPARRSGPLRAPVRFGIMCRGKGAARPHLVATKSVLDRLPGSGAEFSVSLGKKSETRHLLRVERDPEGKFIPTELGKAKGGGVFRFVFAIPNLPRAKADPVACDHEIINGVLYVTLPSWVWNKPAAISAIR